MKKINKKTIIYTSITIFIIATLTTAILIMNNKNKSHATSAMEEKENQNITNEPIEEFANLEDLIKTSNEIKEEKKEESKPIKKTNTAKNTNTKTTSNINKNKYYIKVNYGAQVVNIYTYDKNGKYTVPVKAFVCSTGIETPTSGVYKIPAKIKWCYMYGDVYAQYCTQIVGDILFHSVPYLKRSNDTLEYWAYDKLGTKDSLGCVRLTARDAKWIFDNVSYGTQVEFYSDTNPGPLGKPTAKKISNAPKDLRNWDPTDPDLKNPWRTYKPEKKDNTNTIKDTNIETSKNNTVEENAGSNKENTNQVNNEDQENKTSNEVSNENENNQTSNENQNNQESNTTSSEKNTINSNDNETQNKEISNNTEKSKITNT